MQLEEFSKKPKVSVNCFPTNLESKLLEQMQQLTDQMSKMQTKLDSLETEFRDYKKNNETKQSSWKGNQSKWSNPRDRNSSRDTAPETRKDQKSEDKKSLNFNRPPSQGR